jgi:hypothetical protein
MNTRLTWRLQFSFCTFLRHPGPTNGSADQDIDISKNSVSLIVTSGRGDHVTAHIRQQIFRIHVLPGAGQDSDMFVLQQYLHADTGFQGEQRGFRTYHKYIHCPLRWQTLFETLLPTFLAASRSIEIQNLSLLQRATNDWTAKTRSKQTLIQNTERQV